MHTNPNGRPPTWFSGAETTIIELANGSRYETIFSQDWIKTLAGQLVTFIILKKADKTQFTLNPAYIKSVCTNPNGRPSNWLGNTETTIIEMDNGDSYEAIESIEEMQRLANVRPNTGPNAPPQPAPSSRSFNASTSCCLPAIFGYVFGPAIIIGIIILMMMC
jgi:hypothetical protein